MVTPVLETPAVTTTPPEVTDVEGLNAFMLALMISSPANAGVGTASSTAAA
jgi:hypothetical protein